MITYQYNLINNQKRGRKIKTITIRTGEDPLDSIITSIVREKQWKLFSLMFATFTGNYNNTIEVKRHLPKEYKKYANNLEMLRYELYNDTLCVHDYRIEKITRFSFCQGCKDFQANQEAHMDCPDGCLHSPCEQCHY